MAKARVKVPKSVKKGEVFEVKTLISHKMETGQRKDKKTGKKIPRMIINKFVCTYNGKEVFTSDWHPAISANPYMAFFVKAGESGNLDFTWTDDKGKATKKSAKVTVTG
ncbi:MAG: thiosulfate oxidation carrier complex protein SoxZ [Magnetovibrio sp.]|nr:thiosulfate oxidation carrier complex protein SoxZ [Magnetovibrio sp.]